MIAFLRKGKIGAPHVVAVCNFTPVPRYGYRVGVPAAGFYVERLNTDALEYSGSGVGNRGGVVSEPIASQNRPHSLLLTLPPKPFPLTPMRLSPHKAK